MTGEWTMDDASSYGAGLLRGERVILRPVERDDLDRFADWWREGELAVLQGPQFRPPPHEGMVEVIRKLSANESGATRTTAFAVTDASGELLGHVSLRGLTLPLRIVEFGIVMAPTALSQGYGTDATRVMLRYAFLELGANKVELLTWEFNTRAIAAYTRVGFVEEGRQRAGIFKDGRFMDVVRMGILADEWHAANDGAQPSMP